MKHRTLSATLTLVVFLVAAFFVSDSRVSGVTTKKYLTGYAWSSNIGWISFSGSSPQYHVYINNYDPSVPSYLSGYAWSSNIGWINFGCGQVDPRTGNTAQTKLCSEDNTGGSAPAYPSGGEVSSGPVLTPDNKLKGWIRACAVFESGCDGPLKSDFSRGGWDGWISLSGLTTGGAPYGVIFTPATNKFSNFAWGGGNYSLDGVSNTSPQFPGWISFSGTGYAVSMLDSLPNLTTVSCVHNPDVIGVGTTASWTASINPADSLAHSYVWTGSGITSGQGTNTITITYPTSGTVAAPSVTIDGDSSLTSDCGGTITIGPKEFRATASGGMSARFVRSINSPTIPDVTITVVKDQAASFGSHVDLSFDRITYDLDGSVKAGNGAGSYPTLLATPQFSKTDLDPDLPSGDSATFRLDLTKNQDTRVSDTLLPTGAYHVTVLATPRSGGSIKTISIPLQIDNPSGRVRQL